VLDTVFPAPLALPTLGLADEGPADLANLVNPHQRAVTASLSSFSGGADDVLAGALAPTSQR